MAPSILLRALLCPQAAAAAKLDCPDRGPGVRAAPCQKAHIAAMSDLFTIHDAAYPAPRRPGPAVLSFRQRRR